ncbi:MAG: endonuclease Q family protein [Candidatus Pacearchaeota archaeon]|jgi:uncharacterized protein (TIGR00375 family)
MKDFDFEKAMFADLHIHSRFSRACSKELNFPNLVKWAKVKGLNLLGTGDFTHPVWINEIKENLKDNGKGFYFYEDFPFVITGEISLMYTQGRGRKVHLVLLIPSIEVAEKINEYLDTKGRRDYDGRPIFKIPCDEFTREMKKISGDIEIIPAHIWTPYFGVFGSMSGFNSLKEAFGEEVKNIHAIETGISSDREMNLKIEEISKNNLSIVSFSDSHSFWPWRLGREATIFRRCDSFNNLIKQIRENSFFGTIETDPAYGKYHWDGHAACGFSCSPEESKRLSGVCPKCGRNLTIGVENRVETLSGEKGEEEKKEFRILPLHEIISLETGNGMNTKKVWGIYNKLINEFGNEFKVLLEVRLDDLVKVAGDKLGRLIIKNRLGKIKVKPGYDGEYGVAEISGGEKQGKLF